MKKTVLTFLSFLLIGATSNAQFGPSPWNASSGTFTIPANVTSLQIECWGGGGGGGGARALYNNSAAGAAGGGGGGGACAVVTNVAVTPGQTITITVGSGGNAGAASSGGNGGIGGQSFVSYNSIIVVSADGGAGGTGKYNTDSYSYGSGGSGAFSGVGTTVNKGGNGAGGASNSKGGGGGGGGGTTAVGGNASGLTAGTGGATGGGNGGAGANNNNSAGLAGSPGNVAGGGGGGGAAWTYGISGSHQGAGGAGAAGQVIITYTAHPLGPYWLNQFCTTTPSGSYIDARLITPTRTALTSSTATTPSNYGYVFWSFNATADSTYYFDLCSSTGTTGQSDLRIHNARNTSPSNNYCMDALNTPTLVMENQSNGCVGTGIGLSKLIWTCPASGTYYLESSAANFDYWGKTTNQTAVLTYKTLPSFSFISNTCPDLFYDKGKDGTDGASYNYNNNENWTYTYYPPDTFLYAAEVLFLSFSTSPGDVLCVYDGSSINASIIGCYSGPSITGSFTSTATNGALTFQFTSDDSVISTGWNSEVCYLLRDNGITNHLLADHIKIYPNPVIESLVISHGSLGGENKIDISNVLGERIFSYNSELPATNSELTVDVSTLSSGIYFIRIENEKGEWNGRFVKQ